MERANSARSEKKISSLHDSYITETMSNSVLFFTASKIDHNSEFFNHFKIQIETDFRHMQRYVVVLTAVLATGAIREAAETNILTFCCFLLLPGAQRKLQLKRKRINGVFLNVHMLGFSICRRHCNRKERIGHIKIS